MLLPWKKIHSEAVFGHKYHSFSLTCAHVTSTWNLQSHMLIPDLDLSFPHHFPGTSDFYVSSSPGMPRCSYATAHPPSPPLSLGIKSKKVGSSCQAKLIVTLSFLSVTVCTGGCNVTVGGRSFSMFDWQKYSFTTEFARNFSKNNYKFKNEIKIPTTVSSMDS